MRENPLCVACKGRCVYVCAIVWPYMASTQKQRVLRKNEEEEGGGKHFLCKKTALVLGREGEKV